MEKIKCVIVDDEKFARELIEDYLSKHNRFSLLGKFRNITELNTFLNTSISLDLIFLDIQMPGETGIDFLKHNNLKPKIVFITAYPEYALDGFELEVLDYLLKPISEDRFNKSIYKIESIIRTEKKAIAYDSIQFDKQNFMILKNGVNEYKVEFKDLVRIEADSEYIRYYSRDNNYYILGSLKHIIKELPENFVQVHRSHIISKKYIKAREKYTLILEDGTTIPIGKTYRKRILNNLLY